MDSHITQIINSIWHTQQMQEMMMKEDPDFVSEDELVISIGPDAGKCIHDVIISHSCKNILEIGTSHGYSTLWMADAVQQTGGHITTIEKNPAKIKICTENFRKARMQDTISVKEGDAKNIISALKKEDGLFDLVLIDARKDEYISYAQLVIPLLKQTGIIIADNMVRPVFMREHAQNYQIFMQSLPFMETKTEHIGNGLEISTKIGHE